MTELLRTCNICKREKPITDFYRYSGRRTRMRKCKRCFYEKYYPSRKSQSTSEKRRRHHLRRYGITQAKYNQMYQEQKGKCAICKRFKEKLGIDHCHKTDRVRALLCSNCNTLLGLAHENPKILKRAIRYLSAHAGSN